MTIHNDYEHSSGPVIPIQVPYARLTAAPVPSNPCEITRATAVGAGDEATTAPGLCGTLLSTDASDSIAVVNVAPCFVGYWQVRNVLTYNPGVGELTFGAINIGDRVYYDSSASMPAGVFLSTSPLNTDNLPNTLFGHVVLVGGDAEIAAYPKGNATVSTQLCHVIQRGAGA
jgi:hypothetical protein